jgi:hypothetical protein
MMTAPVIGKRAADLQGFRITPGDTNYFALIASSVGIGYDRAFE